MKIKSLPLAVYLVNKRLHNTDAMSALIFFSPEVNLDSETHADNVLHSAHKLTFWEPILDASQRKDYSLLQELIHKERKLIIDGVQSAQPLEKAFLLGQMQTCYVLERLCAPCADNRKQVELNDEVHRWGTKLFSAAEDERSFEFVNYFLLKREQTLLALNRHKTHLRHVINSSVAARHSENFNVSMNIVSRLRKMLQTKVVES